MERVQGQVISLNFRLTDYIPETVQDSDVIKSIVFLLSYVVFKWIWTRAWFQLGHSAQFSCYFVADTVAPDLTISAATRRGVYWRKTQYNKIYAVDRLAAFVG